MPEPLSADEVRKVARLSRLRLDEARVEQFRHQLADVLGYIGLINELDVEGVEPMAHPLDVTNRLDDDLIGPSLSRSQALKNAPAVEGPYIAVPKVLGGEESSS